MLQDIKEILSLWPFLIGGGVAWIVLGIVWGYSKQTFDDARQHGTKAAIERLDSEITGCLESLLAPLLFAAICLGALFGLVRMIKWMWNVNL